MRRVFLILFLSGILISCDSNEVFSDYESMPGSWNKDEAVSFSLPQMDSTKTYDLFINIRNNNEFKYSNLFLIVTMNFPHGKVIKDTLEYQMALPDGTWLGTGFGSVKENKLWYKENIRFFEEGSYSVEIQHAMRKAESAGGIGDLEGITDVGFSVEE